MPAFSSIALGISAAAAVAGAATTISQGQDAARRGKHSLIRQQNAQEQAKDAAAAQARQAEMANAQANKKAPDVGTILLGEQDPAKMGAGATLLSGANGIDPNRLLLGRGGKLGG